MLELLNDLPPALQWPVRAMAVVTTLCYVLSETTGNVSQVDRLWALLPLSYAAYFALLPLWPTSSLWVIVPYLPTAHPAELSADYSPRAVLMLVLTVRWLSARVLGIAHVAVVRLVCPFALQRIPQRPLQSVRNAAI
jgi:steroid 5-alpha reductase family enzyme